MIPIIGKDKTGYGFLIENDGYISPDDNLEVIKEFKATNFKPNEAPIFYAVLQKYGILNGNGRIYPEQILKKECERYKELIKMGASAGEVDHPESTSISVQNIGLQILDIWWEGATLVGKIKLPVSRGFLEQGICSCPADIVFNNILNGIKLGVSSRAIGTVKNMQGKKIVQNDLELLCWDVVSTPSTKGSWIVNQRGDTEQYIQRKVEENIEKNEMVGKLSGGFSNAMKRFLKK